MPDEKPRALALDNTRILSIRSQGRILSVLPVYGGPFTLHEGTEADAPACGSTASLEAAEQRGYERGKAEADALALFSNLSNTVSTAGGGLTIREALEQARGAGKTAAIHGMQSAPTQDAYARGYQDAIDWVSAEQDNGTAQAARDHALRTRLAAILGCELSDIVMCSPERDAARRGWTLMLRVTVGGNTYQEFKNISEQDFEDDDKAEEVFHALVYEDLAHRIKRARDRASIDPNKRVKRLPGPDLGAGPDARFDGDQSAPCDDCGRLTNDADLITKGDHHGGTETVCRDRDACHRREALNVRNAPENIDPLLVVRLLDKPNTQYQLRGVYVKDGKEVSVPVPTSNDTDEHPPAVAAGTFYLADVINELGEQLTNAMVRKNSAAWSASLRTKLAASEVLHGPFVHCQNEDD